MTRNNLDVDTNQFDDSLENIESKYFDNLKK